MFLLHIKEICILLLLGRLLYKHQLGKVVDNVPNLPINNWFCLFSLLITKGVRQKSLTIIVDWIFISYIYKLSYWVYKYLGLQCPFDKFIITKQPSLYLVIFFALKFTFFLILIVATPTFFWSLLAWYIFPHSFYFWTVFLFTYKVGFL